MVVDENHSAYSVATWKRQPTTAEVCFGLELPYRSPSSFLGAFVWRQRMWLETTFALSMLQPWEKVLIMTIAYGFLTLLCTAIFFYLPHHLVFLYSRAMYYLLGTEDSAGVSEPLVRFISGWGWSDTSLWNNSYFNLVASNSQEL